MPQTVSRSQPNGKNKQAQTSAVLFSICNKPPERQATASCLAHREWNRLYTWENTAHWVAFFNRIPGTLLKSPVRSHLQVLWAGLCLRDRKGRREEYGSEEIWKNECKLFLSGEGRELSGTPVRRMSKVHLFIPSSFVRCHSLKTGLSENTAHLFLPASVTLSLCFSHKYERTHTYIHRQRGRDANGFRAEMPQCKHSL